MCVGFCLSMWVWLWELENVPQHFLCSSSLQLWRMQLWRFSCSFLSVPAPSIVFPLFSLPNSLLYLTHSSLVHDDVENDEKRIVAVPVGWIENTLVEQAGKNEKVAMKDRMNGNKRRVGWLQEYRKMGKKTDTHAACVHDRKKRGKNCREITYTKRREELTWK